jgi:hypothetical protein
MLVSKGQFIWNLSRMHEYYSAKSLAHALRLAIISGCLVGEPTTLRALGKL